MRKRHRKKVRKKRLRESMELEAGFRRIAAAIKGTDIHSAWERRFWVGEADHEALWRHFK